jgi:hypothetical protein
MTANRDVNAATVLFKKAYAFKQHGGTFPVLERAGGLQLLQP